MSYKVLCGCLISKNIHLHNKKYLKTNPLKGNTLVNMNHMPSIKSLVFIIFCISLYFLIEFSNIFFENFIHV